jgi:hypothetical protein
MISLIINFISDIITLICKIIKLQKETSKDINNDDKINEINFLRKTLEENKKDNIIIDLRKENKSLNEINKNNNLIITKKDNIIIELKKEIINLKDIIELNNF